jgi:hypothetical protein
MRLIDRTLQGCEATVDGREKGFAVHGNRFVAHHVFRRLLQGPVDGSAAQLPTPAEVGRLVEDLLAATAEIADSAYPGAYLAQLFKNQAKLGEIGRLGSEAE